MGRVPAQCPSPLRTQARIATRAEVALPSMVRKPVGSFSNAMTPKTAVVRASPTKISKGAWAKSRPATVGPAANPALTARRNRANAVYTFLRRNQISQEGRTRGTKEKAQKSVGKGHGRDEDRCMAEVEPDHRNGPLQKARRRWSFAGRWRLQGIRWPSARQSGRRPSRREPARFAPASIHAHSERG